MPHMRMPLHCPPSLSPAACLTGFSVHHCSPFALAAYGTCGRPSARQERSRRVSEAPTLGCQPLPRERTISNVPPPKRGHDQPSSFSLCMHSPGIPRTPFPSSLPFAVCTLARPANVRNHRPDCHRAVFLLSLLPRPSQVLSSSTVCHSDIAYWVASLWGNALPGGLGCSSSARRGSSTASSIATGAASSPFSASRPTPTSAPARLHSHTW